MRLDEHRGFTVSNIPKSAFVLMGECFCFYPYCAKVLQNDTSKLTQPIVRSTEQIFNYSVPISFTLGKFVTD
jgi:hypothetical protein